MEGDAYTQYKAMIVATGLQLLLLMFELLACDKLGSNPHKMMWILIFIPLFCIAIASIGLCIWALKHGRTFEVSPLLVAVPLYDNKVSKDICVCANFKQITVAEAPMMSRKLGKTVELSFNVR